MTSPCKARCYYGITHVRAAIYLGTKKAVHRAAFDESGVPPDFHRVYNRPVRNKRERTYVQADVHDMLADLWATCARAPCKAPEKSLAKPDRRKPYAASEELHEGALGQEARGRSLGDGSYATKSRAFLHELS